MPALKKIGEIKMRAKQAGQSALLLLDVIDLLKAHNIPYAVVGAFAVSFYGIVRASLDADAVISLAQSDVSAEKLKRLLEKSSLKAFIRRADADDPLKGLMLIEDKFGNQVDLILGIKGMDSHVFSRVKKGKFQKENIDVIGPEDLIAMKLFAGSGKDLNDVIGILEVSKKEINFALLKKVIKSYGSDAQKRLDQVLK